MAAVVSALASAGCHRGPIRPLGPRDTLRVMTYQVNGGQGLDAARRVASEWNVDVLLLQDARRPSAGSLGADIVREVADALRMEIAWLSLNDAFGGVSGLAILSRVGVERVRRQVFDRLDENGPLRGALGIDVDWGGETYTIWTTQWSGGEGAAGRQHAEARQLLLAMQAAPETPDILGGDLAVDPKAAPLDALRATLRDAWAAGGSGLGYTDPSDLPRRRADYVWFDAKSDLALAGVWVINAPGESARLPLIADFARVDPNAPPPAAPGSVSPNGAATGQGAGSTTPPEGAADGGEEAPADLPDYQPAPGQPDLPGITRPWGPRRGR